MSDSKKRIIWMIQQTERVGGTEMVSLNISKALIKYFGYEVKIVVTSHFVDDPFCSLEGLDVNYLNVPMEVVRFDEFFNLYINNHEYFKALKLMLLLLYHFIFKRFIYQKKVLDLTNDDDIIVASSLDSYIFAPKKRKIIHHYHFDSKDYLDRTFNFMINRCTKPIKTVFLTNSARNNIVKVKTELKDKSLVIPNPSRYERKFCDVHENLNFIFIGRLEKQKNPEMMIEIAKIMNDNGFKFHIDVCGSGSKQVILEEMIKNYGLNDVVSLNGAVRNIEDYLLKSDGQIVTSITEGFALSIIEANSYSIYTISTPCGNAIKEVITNGENGYVMEDYDVYKMAMKIMQTFKGDYSSLKMKTYEYAKRYDIKSIASIWDVMFSEI